MEVKKQLLQYSKILIHSTLNSQRNWIDVLLEEIFSSVTLSPLWPLYNKNGWYFFNSQYKRSLLCFIEMSPREQIFYPIIYYFYIYWNNLKSERFLMWQRLKFRGESLSITWKWFWDISQPASTCSNALQSWWMDSLMLLWYPADRFITPNISPPWSP